MNEFNDLQIILMPLTLFLAMLIIIAPMMEQKKFFPQSFVLRTIGALGLFVVAGASYLVNDNFPIQLPTDIPL